ncbi:Alpha/beta hydrolase family protein [Variovorax sp. SRS16]|uniref:alpha/beta fold hydrolase n=1 Tax=Variovorax sp. SRS16 TaxID=282217 RepID=UPI001317BB34|nr:Alpha/beta hydrolase family protein [Variovorax sp. SRS16]
MKHVGQSAMRALLAATGALSLLLGGCGLWRPAKVPMDSTLSKSSCTASAETLLVMLPGAYSRPDEFVREGFLAALDERRLAVDVLRVDAHLGYYNNGSIFERLQADVFAPARAQGYRSIWILGISVGGLGALGYAEMHPGEIAGIVALAPYLGERLTSTEIANAGGLARWRAPAGPLSNDKGEQRLWRWLQRYGTGASSPDLPPLYLGHGQSDRFAFSHQLLAAVLPPERVFTTEGGHDWPQWRRLWHRMLPTLPLPACPA